MSGVSFRLPTHHVCHRTYNKERARDGVPVCSLWFHASFITESGSTFRVYLGNLSFNVNDEVLKKHFASCGTIERIDYITDKTTGKFYGCVLLLSVALSSVRFAYTHHHTFVAGRRSLSSGLKKPLRTRFCSTGKNSSVVR